MVEQSWLLLETIRRTVSHMNYSFVLTMVPLFLENLKLPMDKQLSLEHNKAFYFPFKKRKVNRKAAQTRQVMRLRLIFTFFYRGGGNNWATRL